MEAGKFDLLAVAGLRPKKRGADKKYATFNGRMLAATIDSLLLTVTTPFLNAFFNRVLGAPRLNTQALIEKVGTQTNPLVAWVMIGHEIYHSGYLLHWFASLFAQLLIYCIFSGICWHFWAATPGKMVMRMKVVDAVTEAPISDRQIVLRMLGYFVSAFGFFMGFFWIIFDKRRQGWHDKIAGTIVIAKPWFSFKSDPAAVDPSNSPAP